MLSIMGHFYLPLKFIHTPTFVKDFICNVYFCINICELLCSNQISHAVNHRVQLQQIIRKHRLSAVSPHFLFYDITA